MNTHKMGGFQNPTRGPYRHGRNDDRDLASKSQVCQKHQLQTVFFHIVVHCLSSHLLFNHEDHWGTTADFATSFLHFSLFSTAFWDLPNSRPVHSRMLSSHLYLCLPCLLPPFTVSCKMVLARPDEVRLLMVVVLFANSVGNGFCIALRSRKVLIVAAG